jgi:hypothetical protein
MFNHKDPEFANVETFAQFLMDEDRTSFLPGEAQAVARATGQTIVAVMDELRSYGFTITNRVIQGETRGVNSNPNGTHPFSGSGSTFTTSGHDSIMGFAGNRGW